MKGAKLFSSLTKAFSYCKDNGFVVAQPILVGDEVIILVSKNHDYVIIENDEDWYLNGLHAEFIESDQYGTKTETLAKVLEKANELAKTKAPPLK